MSLTSDQIKHVALLSRLEFSDDEITRLGSELNSILAYMEKLSELDTENVPATSHALKTSNVLRADEPRPSLTNEEALANAPESEDGHFKVPQILPGD